MVSDTYFDQKVENVHFVAVSINYERVLEGETFPFELLGETKVKESLLRMIKSVQVLGMNFGSINIEFGDPISLKEFTIF